MSYFNEDAHETFDTAVYGANQLFRAVNQTKEQEKGSELKTQEDEPITAENIDMYVVQQFENLPANLEFETETTVAEEKASPTHCVHQNAKTPSAAVASDTERYED